MRRRPLRDELREVFDDLSEPAHPALSARVRERLEGPAPDRRVPRLAVAVALLLAVLLVGSLVVAGRLVVSRQAIPAGVPTPTSVAPTPVPSGDAPSPGVSPAASPGVSPVASPGAGLAAFSCAATSGGGAAMPTPPVGVTAVRVGGQGGYDRFVIELNGPVPHFAVGPQASARFVRDASGQPVTLRGSAGLVVRLQGAQAHGTYSGSADLRPTGAAAIQEASQIGDFEGVVTWGLGLSRAACFRAFTLTSPSRLVVDVQV
jgi:hypothetical protein